MSDTILVTGVTGQIGHYVAEAMSRRGARVFGLVRQTTTDRFSSTGAGPYTPVSGDLLDEYSLLSILEKLQPTRVFNFAAQSFIPSSWTQPILTAQYTALGVVRLLEAMRRTVPACRFLQAGSSEIFAGCNVTPQDESTPARPRNPYGIAKAFAAQTVAAYREHYGAFASNAYFYTNESPRRSPEFLLRKVTRAAAEIAAGRRSELTLGNLETVRDWGWAPEYAGLAIAILEAERPDDFVVATGEGHSVRELVELAFGLLSLDWQKYVRVDETLVRPSEPAPLVGDTAKLRRVIGRAPELKLADVVRRLLAHDLQALGVAVPFPPGQP
jgi:GDPmannose 4,6-dehydratase